MRKRRVTKPIFIGDVKVGGDAPITVQSMTKTDTRDVKATVQQIKELEEQIKVAPIREQQLAELMRGYANTSSHYSSLVDKSLQSELADNLEILKQSEQFRVIDPASFPVNSSEPNRIRINLLGLAGGLGLGIGLVLLIEMRDSSLRTESDVISCTNLPVLVCVPDLLTAREELRLRLRHVLEWAGGVLIMVSIVAGGLVLYWRS